MNFSWADAAKKPTSKFWLKVFVIAMGIAIAIDLALVWTGHVSISLATWVQTQLHPTLIVAGVLGSCWVALKIRTDWKALFFWGFVAGHLFGHWALFICATTTFVPLFV